MKIYFKIHPDDYDKAANEKFYEQMAEKGWLVTKRWANLSKFVKTEPKQLKFDIYYAEYNYVSHEEETEFKADSRTTVESKSNVYISYSPKSLSLPSVINANEDATKAIIPLKNRSSMLQSPVVLIFMAIFLHNIRTELTYNAFDSLPFFEKALYKIITIPELYIAMLILAAYIIFIAIHERIRWKNAVVAFQNGKNPDDGIRKKALYIFSIFMIVLSISFIAVFSYGNIGKTEYDIPEFSDGLYLDVHDFGIDDKISSKGLQVGDKYISNEIMHKNTLSAQMWLTQEYYDINGTSVIVYQDVIEYKSQKTALYAAELLASNEKKNYSEYKADGFEKVYFSDENLIAVTNNTTYRITYITSNESLIPSIDRLLNAILQKQ